ncbi:MAG: YHYH protein [Nannocystaceae bacterium]|nr:YHYH protein [Nannocystaceae bacterium]
MHRIPTLFVIVVALGMAGCADEDNAMPRGTDITDASFSDRDGTCAARAGSYTATARDLARDLAFSAFIDIEVQGAGCVLSSNGIPNHDFNDTGAFATQVSEVFESFTLPENPSSAATPTELSLQYDNGVFLNGVKLDLLAAACYGVGSEPLGEEKIGCMSEGTPWRYDPMSASASFGTDGHNAHTQPDGAYHYHGNPAAMYDDSGSVASGVIGFAADGFPIYGPWIDEGGTIRKAVSGYALREGNRVSQAGEGAFPGGSYDGTYVDDYEFADVGDLDECNGTTRQGVYGYYVTAAYPWIIGCLVGTPDESFRKGG